MANNKTAIAVAAAKAQIHQQAMVAKLIYLQTRHSHILHLIGCEERAELAARRARLDSAVDARVEAIKELNSRLDEIIVDMEHLSTNTNIQAVDDCAELDDLLNPSVEDDAPSWTYQGG